jgi:hypothetical protein
MVEEDVLTLARALGRTIEVRACDGRWLMRVSCAGDKTLVENG